jgi:hypothetical protein
MLRTAGTLEALHRLSVTEGVFVSSKAPQASRNDGFGVDKLGYSGLGALQNQRSYYRGAV